MVAGHSLGEFSALVAAGALSFEDGLRLVSKRALAMQEACEANPGTMAAILGLPDEKVVEILKTIEGGVVIAANFNCPGQLVISGDVDAVDRACEALKEAGAKRALRLNVVGLPLTSDGACTCRTRRSYRGYGVPYPPLPHLSERTCPCCQLHARYQEEPHRSADGSRTLDGERTGYGR